MCAPNIADTLKVSRQNSQEQRATFQREGSLELETVQSTFPGGLVVSIMMDIMVKEGDDGHDGHGEHGRYDGDHGQDGDHKGAPRFARAGEIRRERGPEVHL